MYFEKVVRMNDVKLSIYVKKVSEMIARRTAPCAYY